jgi:hypothetical protein
MASQDFEVRLPAAAVADQYSEVFILERDSRAEEVAVHDYETIYPIPGLYERLIVDALQCVSHKLIPDLLAQVVNRSGTRMADLRVLDFGAGSGLVGAALARHDVKTIVGLDIVPEARSAARRDHPAVYQAYLVGDICHLEPADQAILSRLQPNCLISVSAIGLEAHISPHALTCAINVMPRGSWVAFNLNASFLETDSPTGYAAVLERLTLSTQLTLHLRHTYQHRILTDGTPLFYTAIIGQKQAGDQL